jgi:hypothetical protein
MHVANKILTSIDKISTYIDPKNPETSELKEIIWKNDIEMNEVIDEEWCLNYYPKKIEVVKEEKVVKDKPITF